MRNRIRVRSAASLAILSALLGGCIWVLAFGVGSSRRASSEMNPSFPGKPQRLGRGALHLTTGSRVVGTVFTSAWAPPQTMAIADLPVYLRETVTQIQTAEVRTDLDGYYLFSDVADGTWQLCTSAPGWVASCDSDPVVVAGQAVGAPAKEFTPVAPVVSGTVTLADNSPCNFHDAFFGVDVRTKVTLREFNDAPVSQTVTANRSGQYLLPAVPTGTYVATAVCEGAKTRMTVNTAGGAYKALTFANARPLVNEVVPYSGGLGVRRATPGATIQVHTEAVDPDADALHYQWIPSSSGAPFTSTDASTVTWVLPTGDSEPLMYVLVRDGKGGYVRRSRRVSTGPPVVHFTGRVRSEDGPPVAGVEVLVNGLTVTTAADGGFSREVPEAPRYVLTVDAPGYELRSDVSSEPLFAQDIRLKKAKVVVVDPARDIVVEDTRPRYVCVGGPNQGQPCPCEDDASCAPGTCEPLVDGLGTRLEIPANSLEDQDGNPPSGPLDLSLSTIDIRQPGRFPGDFSGRNASNQVVRLVSWGAADVKIVDGGGNRFNLRPGATARLAIPVSNPDSPPPATLPTWFYEPDEGVWREDGIAMLKGGRYELTVTHFSAVNIDLEFNNAACVKVVLEPPFVGSATNPVPVRITMLSGVAQGSVFDKLFADQLNALVRLPPGDDMKIEILDAPGGTPVPNQSAIFTIGLATAAGLDLNLAFPYAGCSYPLVFLGASPNPPPGGNFLQYFENTAAEADDYYDAIDPHSTATTFSAWLARNGLSGPGDYDVRAVYFNAGDLALWRGMHMARPGYAGALPDEIVYWVNNYNNSADAKNDTHPPGISVAMEFTREQNASGVPFGDPYTKFFVFKINAAGTDLDRAPSVDLDQNGEKFVPGLCVVCHSGQPYAGQAGEEKMSARFIPFTLDTDTSFVYEPSPWDKATQQPAFKLLNHGIFDPANPPGTAYPRKSSPTIEALITGWYSGTNPNVQDEAYVLPNWRASPPGGPQDLKQVRLYRNVYQTSCRACHASQTAIPFDNYSNLANYYVEAVICHYRYMPQAAETYKKFWLSSTPNRRDELELGLDTLGVPADQCCPCGAPGFASCDTGGLCP